MKALSLQLTPEVNNCKTELSCREETTDCHPELILQSFSCGENAVRSAMALFYMLTAIIVRDNVPSAGFLQWRMSLTASFMQGQDKGSLSKPNWHLKDA